MRSPRTATKSSLHLLQPEKAHVQQRRPKAAINGRKEGRKGGREGERKEKKESLHWGSLSHHSCWKVSACGYRGNAPDTPELVDPHITTLVTWNVAVSTKYKKKASGSSSDIFIQTLYCHFRQFQQAQIRSRYPDSMKMWRWARHY